MAVASVAPARAGLWVNPRVAVERAAWENCQAQKPWPMRFRKGEGYATVADRLRYRVTHADIGGSLWHVGRGRTCGAFLSEQCPHRDGRLLWHPVHPWGGTGGETPQRCRRVRGYLRQQVHH